MPPGPAGSRMDRKPPANGRDAAPPHGRQAQAPFRPKGRRIIARLKGPGLIMIPCWRTQGTRCAYRILSGCVPPSPDTRPFEPVCRVRPFGAPDQPKRNAQALRRDASLPRRSGNSRTVANNSWIIPYRSSALRQAASSKPTRCTPSPMANGLFTRLPLPASRSRASRSDMTGNFALRPRAL